MPGPTTTEDLLSQARAQLDEANTEDVSDADVLAAMNRAQRRAVSILARKFDELFMTSTTQLSTGGTDTYAIPEGAYGRRIEQIVVAQGSNEYPLKRVNYRELARYASSAQVSVPSVWAFKGRSYVIKPTPSGGVTFKLSYFKAPETLVLPQGRITSVSVASSYVLLDALGDDLTTATDALGAFVNIVDAQTGEIKVSLQTNAINTTSKQVSFKTTGLTLSTVYNRTIATAIPATVEVNDYVCATQGTCVPDLWDECLDYLIQYAVYEIRRRMGETLTDEAQALKRLEDDIERQGAGRESSHRIANKSPAWTR